jgi:4-hydroxy-tetrahydrodipicolinate synthase
MRVPSGVYSAMITPLHRGEVDRNGIGRLVSGFRSHGFAGVLVAGSTGEGPLLTREQYRAAVEAATEAANGELTVIAGASEPSVPRALDTLETAAKAGADVALVVLPFYFHSGNIDAVEFFSSLAGNSALPFIIYNFPRIAGQSITPEEIGSLVALDGIVGLKDSSGVLPSLQKVIAEYSSDTFAVLQGLATLAYPSLCLGADGVFSAMSNITPELDRELYNAFLRNEHSRCRALQKVLIDLVRAISNFGSPVGIGVKRALQALGTDSGETLYYGKSGDREDVNELQEILSRIRQLIDSG